MWSPTSIILGSLLLLLFQDQASAQNGEECINPRGQRGICRNIKVCVPLLNLLRAYGNEAGDFLRQSVCGYENRDPLVCCPDTEQKTPQQRNNTYGPLLAPECGTTDAKFTRIVNGVPAKLGAWPWAALLGYHGENGRPSPQWRCGGTLISARHVLTAAHCLHGHDNLYVVRLGELDLDDDNEGATPIDIMIESRTIHPQYSTKNYVNDIAILKLNQDVQFTDLIKPICLPVTDNIRNKDLSNSFPFIAGWGDTQFRGPRSSKLQQVQVPIVDYDQCKYAFRNYKMVTIDERILCAGYAAGGKDACQGDSGGALMLPVDKTWFSVGVISFGYKCAEPGFPGIYTRTISFLDFVLPLLN